MNGETASLYNLSDSQEPREIATLKGETELTRGRKGKITAKQRFHKAREEVKLIDTQQLKLGKMSLVIHFPSTPMVGYKNWAFIGGRSDAAAARTHPTGTVTGCQCFPRLKSN